MSQFSASHRSPLRIGDRVYDASPLSDDGRDAMDAWVREKYTERLAPVLNSLSGAALVEATSQMLRLMPTLTFVSREGSKFVGTIEGMTKLVYEMIRPNHPDVTYEQLLRDMGNPENIRKANEKFKALHELKEPPKGKRQVPKRRPKR